MTINTSILENLRPPVEPLDPEWSAETLATIMAQPSPRRLNAPNRARSSMRRKAWLAAVATMIGVAAVPTVLSSGGASARGDLLQLASVAAKSDGPVIAPGTYLHVKTEAFQKNSNLLGDGRQMETNREAWVRWDGATWAVDTRPSAGWSDYNRFPAPTDDVSFGTPTPEFVASLPDSAPALRKYLDENVSGSNSHNEALFTAVSDLVNSAMLDPATLSVALQVLADVDGVETQDVDVEGRRAVQVSFDRILGVSQFARQSFTVDQATARLLRASEKSPFSSYELDAGLVEVVSEVPSGVLSEFRANGDGARVCADGSEARDTKDPQDSCA